MSGAAQAGTGTTAGAGADANPNADAGVHAAGRDAEALAAITAVLRRYFDGLYFGDTALLREVLHPKAHYATASDGTLLHLRLHEYLPRVDARPKPSDQGHVRTDRIVSVELAGPVTAMARVECSIPGRRFTDLLSLVRLQGRWWILGKVFHAEG